MTTDVRAAIRAAIEDHGPITFAEYMHLALYGTGGYYHRPPVGPAGDFVTSPHVHPVFGELLAAAIRELWTGLGAPEPFRLVEVGAGDGTLARQVLSALAGLPLAYTAVEISEGARVALAAIDGIDVSDEVPPAADVVLGHELLDNLPFRVVRDGNEVRVGSTSAGDLSEVLAPIDEELARAMRHVEAGEGDVAVPVGALAFVDQLGAMLGPGCALLIDYGDVGSARGQVHGYRAHRVVDDVLQDPGTGDITSGVDFAAISRRASEASLVAMGPVTQRDALLSLGYERWAREELARQHELLASRAGSEAVRTWSGRSRATLLVDPTALGRLRWMVLATPGVPAPSWIGGTVRGAG